MNDYHGDMELLPFDYDEFHHEMEKRKESRYGAVLDAVAALEYNKVEVHEGHNVSIISVHESVDEGFQSYAGVALFCNDCVQEIMFYPMPDDAA
jgi:hypothetical protein